MKQKVREITLISKSFFGDNLLSREMRKDIASVVKIEERDFETFKAALPQMPRNSYFSVVWKQVSCQDDKCCYVADIYWKENFLSVSNTVIEIPSFVDPPYDITYEDLPIYIKSAYADGYDVTIHFWLSGTAGYDYGHLGTNEMVEEGDQVYYGISSANPKDWELLEGSPSRYRFKWSGRSQQCIPMDGLEHELIIRGKATFYNKKNHKGTQVHLGEQRIKVKSEPCKYSVKAIAKPCTSPIGFGLPPYSDSCCVDVVFEQSGGCEGKGCIGGWLIVNQNCQGGTTLNEPSAPYPVISSPIPSGILCSLRIPASGWKGTLVLFDLCGREYERIDLSASCRSDIAR